MLGVVRAAREAGEFLARSKDADGSYRFEEWPAVRGRMRSARKARVAVVRLRIIQRITRGFLNPVDDSVFLTVGLRRLGISASFHLGREWAPARTPAGYFAWVQNGEDVISTSLPVKEDYVEICRMVAR